MTKLRKNYSGIMVIASISALLLGLYFTTSCVLADDANNTTIKAAQPSTVPAVTTPAPAAPSLAPLMSALDKVGLADPLTKAGINIYGYVEGGIMHDFSAHSGPTFLGYNNFRDKGILDKVDLNVERTVDATKKQFDVGFHFETIYGADATLIHSNGILDKENGRNQADLLQAYADIAIPSLPIKIRVGKWIELAGFEQYSANIYGAFGDPSKALYSYSYQFMYAEPGTQTGAFATYVLNPQWTFDAGFTRGWNQSVKDANDTLDFLGRITYAPCDKTTVIFVMTEGPEFPAGVGYNLPSGDNSDWWTALDLVITQKATDKLSLGLGFDYVEAPKIPGLEGGAKQWGGIAGYASYAFNAYLTLNTRLEWYQDAAKGFSTGASVGANYYAATVGVAVKPLPNDKVFSHLLLRPEIRYDYANRPVFSSGERDQLTFSMDVLFTF